MFFGLYVTLLIYAVLPEYPPEHKARCGWPGSLPRTARRRAERAGSGKGAPARGESRAYQGIDVLMECDRSSMSLILYTCRGGVSKVAYGRTRITTRSSSRASCAICG